MDYLDIQRIFSGYSALSDFNNYKLAFIDVNKNNGDRITKDFLLESIKSKPNAKILYLDGKTTAGAYYTKEELEAIVKILQRNNIFLIYDNAYANMEFKNTSKQQSIIDICKKYNYDKFVVLSTASKTYGLERARIGLITTPNQKIYKELEKNLYVNVVGSVGDISAVLFKQLIKLPLEERKAFLKKAQKRHELNRDTLICYIESIESTNINPENRELIRQSIPRHFHDGIPNIKLSYVPNGGIHCKIDCSLCMGKYFGNIKIENVEMLYYLFNAIARVITIHSSQMADFYGNSMRLTFSSEQDVHAGMGKIHDFIELLSAHPNPTLLNHKLGDLIKEQENNLSINKNQSIKNSYILKDAEFDPRCYFKNLTKDVLQVLKMNISEEQLEKSLNIGTSKIQKSWKKYHKEKQHIL